MRADPFPLFKRLRAEDPVHWSPVLKSWVLTRYENCRLALTSPSLSAERVRAFLARRSGDPADLAALRDQMDRWMVFRDPPDHTRLRGLANRAFTPQAVAARAPAIASLVGRTGALRRRSAQDRRGPLRPCRARSEAAGRILSRPRRRAARQAGG
jgi:cytochrome P450